MKRILPLVLVALLFAIPLAVYGQPHPVYVEIRNSSGEIPEEGDITFQACLLSNPQEILDENFIDCYYPAFGSFVKINCDQFTFWQQGDVLHLCVEEISSGETGFGEYILNNDASQIYSIDEGGIILEESGLIPEIGLPQQLYLDEDQIYLMNFSIFITGFVNQLNCTGGENIEVQIDNFDVTFTPAENWFGSEYLFFEVVGNENETDCDTMEVIVSSINDIPHADAGTDFMAPDGLPVFLDASESWDLETDSLLYEWTPPEGIFLDDPYCQNPQFTAPQVVEPLELEFILQVDDGEDVNQDSVTVTVCNDEPEQLNIEIEEDNSARFSWTAPEYYLITLGYNIYLDYEYMDFVATTEYFFYPPCYQHVAGVSAVYDDGESEIETIEIVPNTNGSISPQITGINNIFPNPFNPVTNIEFSVETNQNVKLEIFNTKGQKVTTLIDRKITAGKHNVTWKADNIPSGIYCLIMKTDNFSKQEKIVLLK